MPTLETERLVGEPASEGHRDVALALFRNPEVAAWIWPARRDDGAASGPRTPEQVEEILDRFIAHWRAHGFGWWYLRERTSGELIGEVGLQRVTVEDEPFVEVGWTLLPAYWRRGYATEAARAALDHGFGELQLREIVAFALPDNARSLRVMEKLGMAYVREIERAGLRHRLYVGGRSIFGPGA